MRARPLRLFLLAASLALVLAPAPAAPQQNPRGARIGQILSQRGKVKEIPAVALSYDGQHLAWITSRGGQRTLMLASWRGSNAHAVAIPGGCRAEGIRWAPRWNELAVLTRCKLDPSNTKPIRGAIWVIDVNAGKPPRKAANLAGFAQGMQWSRDGRRIAFLYVPGATRLPHATASGNPRIGVIGGGHEQIQRVANIEVAGGTPSMLTPAGWFVHEFRLSPADNQIAYTAAPPAGDDDSRTAKLYVQDGRAGAAPKMLVDPATAKGTLHGLQIALPRWAPTLTRIYFIGGPMSDRGATGGDLYSVPVGGGTPVNLTPHSKVTLSWYTFNYPQGILVTQIVDGTVQVAEYRDTGNTARQTRLWFSVPGVISDGRAALAVSISSKLPRRIAFAQSSFDRPPEVHSGVLGTQPPPAVASLRAGLKATSGKTRSVE